jgi:hypothetical protein
MKLLYTAGTARGGTNLRTLVLNNHPGMRMALDPFIPLFRFYRDSLLREAGREDLVAVAGLVLDDYYFSNTKRDVLQTVQRADPDIPFDMSAWPELATAIARRMELASADLIPHLGRLPAPTFREVFHNTLEVIAATADGVLEWVGFNDNWTAEFMPLVTRLIPDARCMIHLRDPRGVVHSSEYAEPDAAKHPTVASLARHLRKHMAFTLRFCSDPWMRERLLVTRYESFLDDPAGEARRMTDFLGVAFDPDMIDVRRFRRADGTSWHSDWTIYARSGSVWRDQLPRPVAELTEFICDPEMRLFGYKPEVFDPERGVSDAAFRFAVDNSTSCRGWRTDFPELERTLGSELYRKRLLATPDLASAVDVERCFLFPEVLSHVTAVLTGTPVLQTSEIA